MLCDEYSKRDLPLRIGAIHSVVFGGFSAEALGSRMVDCKANVLVTADGVMRGGKVNCT